MKAFLRSIVIVALTLAADNTFAQQNYYLKHFTTENGLPHNRIQAIAQDQTGFLWIGTWDGLSRYDGYEFKNYYHKPGDSTSLPYFNVLEICIDKSNNVWVLTEQNGVSLFDRSTENFSRFVLSETLTSDISLDKTKTLWVNCSNGLFRYNGEKKQFEKFTSESLNNLAGDRVLFDNDGNLWIFGDQLYQCNVNFENRTFKIHAEYKFNSNDISELNTLHKDGYIEKRPDGEIWYLSQSGIFRLEKNTFIKFKGDISEINLNAPVIYGGSTEKPELYLLQNQQYVPIDPEVTENPAFVFVDRNNSVWFSKTSASGFGEGLMKYIQTPDIFQHPLKNTGEKENSFSNYAVIRDRYGNVWTNSRGKNGIYQIKPDGSIALKNQLDKTLWPRVEIVRSILEDSSGIWFGFTTHLLMHYSHNSQKFETVFINKSGLHEKDTPVLFHCLKKDDYGNIIIGSYSLFLYNPSTRNMKCVYKSHSKTPTFTLTRDHRGDYWLGKTTQELIQLNSRFELVKTHVIGKEKYNIEHICTGENNDLWIATLGSGVYHYNPGNGTTEILTTAQGLSNNTTYSILRDKKGMLWITTNQGISCYNPKTKQFRNYGFTDGLEIEEFNSDAVFMAPDGEMFFGGMGGIVRFYPDSLINSSTYNYKSNLVFTDFKVSGKNRLFKKPVYESDTLLLSRGDNNFTIAFSALNLRDPDKVKYRYQMVDYDTEWIETDSRHRTVSYNNLKPGKYEIRVESSNLFGEWANSGKILIVIPAYFYQTSIFKILLIFLILGVITSLIIVYFRQINLSNKNIQNQLKLESLRGQMNPHFIFNSLNSINYFISQNDRLSANRYIADFAKLIRSILTNMSAEYVPLSKEIESIQDYLNLEHLRFGDKFNYSLTIDPDINFETTQIFPGMVQPFIENSLWHGVRALQNREGYIAVSFRQTSANMLQCIVEDDGVGRKKAALGKSNTHSKSRGIGIVNERLKIYNSVHYTNLQVKIEDSYPEREETGTRVIIEIPVK